MWVLLSVLAAGACGGGTPTATSAPVDLVDPHGSPQAGTDGVQRDPAGIPLDAPISADARRRIAEFVETMIPPPLDETSDLRDEWLHRTRALITELEGGGRSLGDAALQAFTGDASDRVVTRRALLSIGARCSPASATPLLIELAGTYGYRIDDRTVAASLLAEVSPHDFQELAGSHLRRRERASKTMPPDEFLLQGWLKSCEQLGTSPVNMCANVSTNLYLEPTARYQAVQALGDFPDDPLGRSALMTCLIESTGDAYLRRKAAQAIRASFNSEEACDLFQDVLSKEVDATFAEFLASTLQLLGCR